MYKKSYMASTAIKGKHVSSDSLVAIKQVLEEVEFLCFEAKLLREKNKLTLAEGMKRLPMSVKLIIIRILEKQTKMPVMCEELIDHLKSEKERLKRGRIHQEKHELEIMIERLEMELKYTKLRTVGFVLSRKKSQNALNVPKLGIFLGFVKKKKRIIITNI